jgi:tRNA uridine 5-carboxymethylaminomethyl modification enzyme
VLNVYLEQNGQDRVSEREKLSKLLKRPSVRLEELLSLDSLANEPVFQSILRLKDGRLSKEIQEQIEIELKYEGYIQRQWEQIEKFDRYEDQKIPIDFTYNKLKALSTEGREKLSRVKPESIGQASRISGVTPSDISVLMVTLRG